MTSIKHPPTASKTFLMALFVLLAMWGWDR